MKSLWMLLEGPFYSWQMLAQDKSRGEREGGRASAKEEEVYYVSSQRQPK